MGAKVTTYNKQLGQLSDIRHTMLQTARATGDWSTATVRTITQTQRLTKAINEQKLTFRELLRHRKDFRAMIEEQHSLRNAFATQMTGSQFGKSSMDLFVPKGVGRELKSWTTEMGVYSETLRAVGQQTINWGKNTQWAGRQIMVGLTVPLGIAAVGMARHAYEIDKQLTRIAKVYDTQTTQGLQGTELMLATERELSQLREDSLKTAANGARVYGAAMKDTLEVEAQLAATGLQGRTLTQATTEVVRIATLGELEYQSAIDTTIALQTAFKLSNEQLAESFNFMNAVENATSLSIQDIADAVPRAASALATLGGTVQEMTVMLVAMREAGVDAAQGANALKSATSRLLNPNSRSIEQFKQWGIDLEKVTRDADGNIFKIMQSLATMTKDLDNLDRQKAIQSLFGTYQFNRLTALWQNLGDAIDATGEATNQTGMALKLMGDDVTTWAATADGEMQRFQQSMSGRFKRAVETFKAELVPLGETILGFVTPVMEGLTKIVGWFNNLSGFNKNLILWGLAIMGVVGPILMLTGIMANLIGQVIKGAGAIGGLIARFRPLDAEMTTQQLLAKRAAMSWDTQTSSAAMLTQAVSTLTAEMERNAIAQGHMLNAEGQLFLGGQTSGVVLYRSQAGQVRRRVTDQNTGKVQEGAASRAQYQQYMLANAAAEEKAAAAVAQYAEKTRLSWQRIAGAAAGVVGLVGSFAMMDFSSATLSSNLMNAAMFAGSIALIGPSLKGAVPFASRIANILGGARFAAMGATFAQMVGHAGIAAGARGFGGMGTALTKVGSVLSRVLPTVLRIFGPIGIIAGGITLLVTIGNKMHELENRQKRINESTKDWANILGFVEQKGNFGGLLGDKPDTYASRVADVKALREANQELVTTLGEAAQKGDDFATVYRLAMQEAIKVVSSGGTAEQARRAFQVALQASGIKDEQIIDKLTLRFASVDLTNIGEVLNEIKNQIKLELEEVPGLDPGWAAQMFFPGADLSDEARAAGARIGRLFADGLLSTDNKTQQGNLFADLIDKMNAEFRGKFNSMKNLTPENKKFLDDIGVETADQLMTAIAEAMEAEANGEKLSEAQNKLLTESIGGKTDLDITRFAVKYKEMMEVLIQSIGDQMGWGPDEIDRLQDQWTSLAGVAVELGINPVNTALLSSKDAFDAYSDHMARAGMAGVEYSEAQQLAILNTYRAKAGLEAATDVTQGFGDAAGDAARAAEDLSDGLDDAAASASQYTNAFKSSMSGALKDVFSEADRLLGEANDAEIERLQKAGDNHQKFLDRKLDNLNDALDAEEKALEKSYDDRQQAIKDAIQGAKDEAEARIDAIQAVIDKEDEQERLRKKMFEAEERRIRRMSEMANRNIDFNAALNRGDLDEAARIFNTNQATTAQWAIEDAQMTEEDQRERRRKAQQQEIEGIKAERDARTEALEHSLEAIKVEREAAMEAFKERKKQQQESIKLAQEEARERTRASVDAAKKKQDADRRALEMELAALREYVPKNETELRQHIARVEAAYATYGHGLQVSGDQWATIIGNSLDTNVAKAAAALQSEINWQQIGQYISDNIGKGTGMTAGQVAEFLRTGKFPEQPAAGTPAWAPPSKIGQKIGNYTYIGNGRYQTSSGVIFEHDGGEVGWSSKDRTSVPRTAGLYPSEIPTVLKRGEFVVDPQGTKHNKDLLEKIRGSSGPVDLMQFEGVRHSGGIIDGIGALPALYGAALAKVHEVAAINAIQAAQARALAARFAGQMTGGIFKPGSGKYPPRVWGRESANTTAAKQFAQQRWGGKINGIGTVGSRSITSDHPWGKALDIMVTRPGMYNYKQPAGIALGNEIADWFVQNPNVFGTKYVIWRDRITSGGGWKPYGHPSGARNDTLQHRDHPHVSLLHKGGLAGRNGFSAPQLDIGGQVLYDNTLANLHKGETMLTKPLSRDLESGIRNLDLNRANEYNVEVNFNGPVNSELDIEKAVYAAIEKRERRNGKARKVTITS